MPLARWAALLLVFVLLSHVPSASVELKTDDFLQHAMLVGNDQLASLGFATAKDKPLLTRWADAFHFFNSEYGTIAPQRDFGNLPWWSIEQGKMHPFRPLAALTHWLDYEIFNTNPWVIHGQSLLYFMFFAGAALLWYRRLTADTGVIVLATALLVFDLSMSGNWNWVAARNAYLGLALGITSLVFYTRWRETGSLLCCGLSLLFFGLALLAAEASIALLGYFGAYGLTRDKQGWFRGCVAVLPAFVLMVLWRVYYNHMGYGASGIGLYIDPGQNLSGFITQLITAYPLICVSLITGIDGLMSPFNPDSRWLLVALCWVITLACLWLVRPLWRQSATVRFMLLGSIMAVVPYVSSFNPSFRSSTFVALGFFYVVAVWLLSLIRHSAQVWKKVAAYGLVTFWGVVPAGAALAHAWHLLPIQFVDTGLYKNSEQALQENANRSLLILNFGSVSQLYYVPYEWSYRYGVLPKRLQTLTPGLSTFTIKRVSENQLLIDIPQGLVLNQSAAMIPLGENEEAVLNPRFKYRVSEGLFTSPEQQWKPRQIIDAAGMHIEITAVTNNQPIQIQVTFVDNEPLETKLWQWFDWESMQFKAMSPLAVGEQRTIAGPLSQ